MTAKATPLDIAYQMMAEDAQNDVARLGFYERLADCELFLMLKKEVGLEDESVEPEVFDSEGAQYVLIFDREERLAAFSGQITPYVALSGRVIVGMLAGQNIGLGLNLDVAPSSTLLSADAVMWLHETLDNTPDEIEAAIVEVMPPVGLTETLIQAIDTKLATAMGLATSAYLVGVTYDTGIKGHLLGFVGAVPEAEQALARAASEALTFSGVEAGAMDVAFFHAKDPIAQKLEKTGLRFDLPQLQQSAESVPSAPGMDPAKPPKLK